MDKNAGTPLPAPRTLEQNSSHDGDAAAAAVLKTASAQTQGAAEAAVKTAVQPAPQPAAQDAPGTQAPSSVARAPSAALSSEAQAAPRRINAAQALSGRTSAIIRGQLRPPKSGIVEPPSKSPSLTTFTPAQTVAALSQYEATFEDPKEESQGVLGANHQSQMELPEWQKFQGVIARARARALQKHALVDKGAEEEDYKGSLLDKIQALKSKIEHHVTTVDSDSAVKTMGESLQEGQFSEQTAQSAEQADEHSTELTAQVDQFERNVDSLVAAARRDQAHSQAIPEPVNPLNHSVEIPLDDPSVRAAMQPLRCPDLDPGKSLVLGGAYLQPPQLQTSPVPYCEESAADGAEGAPRAEVDVTEVTAAAFSHDGPVPQGMALEQALAQALDEVAHPSGPRPYQELQLTAEDSTLSDVMMTEDGGEAKPHSACRGGYLPCYALYDFAQDQFLLDEGSCRLLGLTYSGEWIPHALMELQVEFIDKEEMLNILFNPEAGDSIFSHVRINQGTHQGERLFFNGSVVMRDDTGIALLVSGFFARIQADFLECLAKIKNHSSSFDIDAYTGEIHFGVAIYQMLGLKPEESLPRSLIEFEKRYIHPDDLLIYRKQGDVVSNPSLGDYYESIYRLKHSGGYYIWCIDRGLVVERKRSGKASRIIGTTTNIDVVRSNFERLKRTIYQDPLTGLHNRLYLNTRNKFFTMEESQPLSLVYVDISGLKVINDYLGHAKGDALVKLAVTVLAQDIFLDHELVRLSGDEFLLIFPCCSHEQCSIQMERFVADLNRRNSAHEFPLPVFIGYGIATLNEIDDGDTFMRCEQRADERLKYYKQQHHDEIYDALRSFIEEMLGHSIDLSDNRVLDYLDHADQAQRADPSSDGAGSACAVSAGSAQSQGAQDD